MPKTALVTGANQGLGYALVKELAARLAPQDTIHLAARSKQRGEEAVRKLGETRAKVNFVQLDVTDAQSIAALAETLAEGADIVASNAAARIVKDRPMREQARAFIETNNHGSRNLFGALAPLLRSNARYAMVASSYGQLRHLHEMLRSQFDHTKHSLDYIEEVMDVYVQDVENEKAKAAGWPEWINIPSKAGQVATARIAARDIARDRPDDGILINAICPGLMDTDASRPWFDDMSGAKKPDEAAQPIVDLLLLPPGTRTPSGELVQDGRVLDLV